MNSCRSMAVTWVPLAARVDRRYALAPALVMSCATAHAQACQGVPRLGVLSYFPAPSALRPDPFETSSLKALRETGYVHAEDVIRETEAGAQRLGLQMQIVRVNGAGGFEAGFATARKQHAQGVVRLAAWPHRARVAAIVLRYRMPSPGESSEEARDGFLLGYGVDLDDLDRHTVTKLDKIVKGARAGELPIERPTKVRLTVNLKNARAIGATIPQSLLLRADEVIQ